MVSVRQRTVLNDEAHKHVSSLQLQVAMVSHRTDNLHNSLFYLNRETDESTPKTSRYCIRVQLDFFHVST